MRKSFLYTALLLAVLSAAACMKKRDDSMIRIGEFGSMTGSEATFGISNHEGLVLAIEEANAIGGVKGKSIQVISVDDQGKPEEAVVGVTKLITQDKVHVVIGEVASSRSLAAAPLCQKNHVPMISPSSTNPKVTQVGDYIFRMCFIDPFQGQVMADFAIDTLKAKTAVVLRDQKSDYSMGLADFFTKRFSEKGGKVLADQSYVSGDIDFKSQLTSLREKNADVVFVPGYYTEVGLIAKQARELGIRVPLLGGDGWTSDKLYEIGGAALNGCFYSNHYATDTTDPQGVEFVAKYKKRWNHAPDSLAVLAYDAGWCFVEAAKHAKSLNGPDLREAIAQTKDFLGVTGKITLGPDRNAVKAAVVLKISGGKTTYLATVNP
jgi:branched-chain amino acid transport system substrate-binding protein